MNYIVVDLLGSDKGPSAILEGINIVLNEHSNLGVAIVGPIQEAKTFIKEHNIDESRIEYVDANDTVTNFDNPTECYFKKPDASIFQATKLLTSDKKYIGMITVGNSGAVLMSALRFAMTPEMTRPCIAAVLPNAQKGFTCLVDTGATIDCTKGQLLSFAKLGRDFMKYTYKIDNPRIGLLSNGAEKTKGNHLVKETYPLLEADESLNFVGNVEGNKALAGLCDVLVCDGFAGNQVLKNSEGMAVQIITEMMKYGKMTGKEAVCGEIAQYLMKTFDFESLGGGIVLGAAKPIMKCRGSSGKEAIRNVAHMLVNISLNKAVYEGEDERC